jgi:hypothetical protein
MAPTLIETTSFSLTLDMPETLSFAMKIDAFVGFLIGNHFGTERLTWQEGESFVSLVASRTPRSAGAYYRDPYPLTLALELSSGSPSLSVNVSQGDTSRLVSALRKYANTLSYEK